jgi:hypothetical protein
VSTTGPVNCRFEPLGGAAPAAAVLVCDAADGVVAVVAPADFGDGLDDPHAASSTDADTAAVERTRFTARA